MTTIKNLKNDKPTVKLSLLDRLVSSISPRAGLQRMASKYALSYMHNTGFISSRTGKRSMFDWFPRARTADEDTVRKLPDIRASCRDLAMNMPIATGALERVKVNAVGTGLVLQSQVDRGFLNLTDEQADEWERNTEREFRVWSESTECDASNEQNFYELQQLALYNTLLSGDVFAAMLSINRNNFPYNFKIKMIEADQCCNPSGTMDGILAGQKDKTLIAGIERDEHKAPIGYHFKKESFGTYSNTWTRVDAFGESGLRNVLHLFDRIRPGQSRGIPMLAPVIEPLKQLVRYSDAELMSTIIASFYTVFIKSKSPHAGGIAPIFGAPNSTIPGSPPVTGDPTDDEERKIELAPGATIELAVDEEIDIADPGRPNKQFEPFFLAFVKQIGSALNIPFEELILHFSSSYSASRAALLQAWKFYRMRREWLCWKFCNPVYLRWLTEAVALDRIQAPGFFEDVSITMAWAKAAWGGPGMGQIDPKKETEAATMKINAYLSNREIEATAIHGGSTGRWEGLFKRNISEKKQINKATEGMKPDVVEPESKPDDQTLEDLQDQQ